MQPNEFKEWRRRLGLTQEKAAELIGTSRVTIGNWESGDTPIWVAVERVCRDVERHQKMRDEYGPVTLSYANGPPVVGRSGRAALLQIEEHPNIGSAIQRLLAAGPVFLPLISDAANESSFGVIWNSMELKNEIERRRSNISSVEKPGLAERLMQIGREAAALPVLDPNFTDHDLYDEDGLPK